MSLPEIDASLFFIINRDLKNSVLDVVMPFVTNNSKMLFLPLVFWILIKERRAVLIPFAAAALSVAFADAGGNMLKELIGRVRPCNALQAVNLLVGCSGSYSMPSNHAVNAFAFAGVFWFFRRGFLGSLFILLAAAVGVSRVYVGVHYPFDVVAGAALGLFSSWLFLFLCRWSQKMYEGESYHRLLLLSLGLLSLFRFYYIFTGPLDLSPDEAHYWEWARRPDWSYYSKGPLIAWLVYAGTAFLGNTVLGVRFFAPVLLALSSLLIFRLGKDLYDERTGFVAAMLVQLVPLYAAFGALLTIDSPFIFFWALSLYLFHKAAWGYPSDSRSRDGYWALLGLSIGLGLLTKYTMAFFYPCCLLFLLLDKDSRRLLLSRGPYIALALSSVVFSPVVFWNAGHGWVTVRHTAGQANVAGGLQLTPKYFFEFLGSQLGIITPILFIMICAALWMMRKERAGRFLVWFSLPVALFFVLKSIQGKVQANWALAGYATGFIAFARYYWNRPLQKAGQRAAVAAVALAVVVTGVSHYPALLRLPQRIDPTTRLSGWAELGHAADKVASGMPGPLFVFSDSYQVAGELAFYMKGHPVTYCANLGRRMNQYDLWPGFEGLVGQNAILVVYGDQYMPGSLERAFSRWEKTVADLLTRQGRVMKFTIFKCYDFKGIEKRPVETY